MVLMIDDDDDGFPDHVSSLFYETPCAATSCGSRKRPANGPASARIALPTSASDGTTVKDADGALAAAVITPVRES